MLPACKKSAQFIDLFLSWDKADFKVPGPKRSQPYLTMCIPKVTFSFPDTMFEHAKNQLNFRDIFDLKSWNLSGQHHFDPSCLKACIEILKVLSLLWLCKVPHKRFPNQDLSFEKKILLYNREEYFASPGSIRIQ